VLPKAAAVDGNNVCVRTCLYSTQDNVQSNNEEIVPYTGSFPVMSLSRMSPAWKGRRLMLLDFSDNVIVRE